MIHPPIPFPLLLFWTPLQSVAAYKIFDTLAQEHPDTWEPGVCVRARVIVCARVLVRDATGAK